MKRWPVKDPDELLDYEIDWSDRLGATDTILTVTWTLPSGLTLTDQDNTTTVAVAWISGGVAGTNYDVDCLIVTNQGRTYNVSVRLPIRDR